ncbi:WxL domain-containing protein [Lacticaseibacillus baoqingensis]|uniref:WxL domain-containing protein n=1 Tax=Lacticaseibacillus baoqingensis TaxID=2486013 RepID=A0ABW4E7S5_9LACO|nr:WxL domain-containing protein [Lacticaseibacillus baoqingensis]
MKRLAALFATLVVLIQPLVATGTTFVHAASTIPTSQAFKLRTQANQETTTLAPGQTTLALRFIANMPKTTVPQVAQAASASSGATTPTNTQAKETMVYDLPQGLGYNYDPQQPGVTVDVNRRQLIIDLAQYHGAMGINLTVSPTAITKPLKLIGKHDVNGQTVARTTPFTIQPVPAAQAATSSSTASSSSSAAAASASSSPAQQAQAAAKAKQAAAKAKAATAATKAAAPGATVPVNPAFALAMGGQKTALITSKMKTVDITFTYQRPKADGTMAMPSPTDTQAQTILAAAAAASAKAVQADPALTAPDALLANTAPTPTTQAVAAPVAPTTAVSTTPSASKNLMQLSLPHGLSLAASSSQAAALVNGKVQIDLDQLADTPVTLKLAVDFNSLASKSNISAQHLVSGVAIDKAADLPVLKVALRGEPLTNSADNYFDVSTVPGANVFNVSDDASWVQAWQQASASTTPCVINVTGDFTPTSAVSYTGTSTVVVNGNKHTLTNPQTITANAGKVIMQNLTIANGGTGKFLTGSGALQAVLHNFSYSGGQYLFAAPAAGLILSGKDTLHFTANPDTTTAAFVQTKTLNFAADAAVNINRDVNGRPIFQSADAASAVTSADSVVINYDAGAATGTGTAALFWDFVTYTFSQSTTVTAKVGGNTTDATLVQWKGSDGKAFTGGSWKINIDEAAVQPRADLKIQSTVYNANVPLIGIFVVNCNPNDIPFQYPPTAQGLQFKNVHVQATITHGVQNSALMAAPVMQRSTSGTSGTNYFNIINSSLIVDTDAAYTAVGLFSLGVQVNQSYIDVQTTSQTGGDMISAYYLPVNSSSGAGQIFTKSSPAQLAGGIKILAGGSIAEWERGNTTATPSYSSAAPSPFSQSVLYTGSGPQYNWQFNGLDTSPAGMVGYTGGSNTRRLVISATGGLDVALNPVTTHATKLTGTTLPNAYVRLSLDNTVLGSSLTIPSTDMVRDAPATWTSGFTVKAGADGKFSFDVPAGTTLTAGQTVTAFAVNGYAEGTGTTKVTAPVDHTPPTADPKTVTINAGQPTPVMSAFLDNIKDDVSPADKIQIKWATTNTDTLENLAKAAGEHDVYLTLTDEAGNVSAPIKAKLVVNNYGPTTPKDPNDPTKDAPDYENGDGNVANNTGDLRLDYVPSFHFGTVGYSYAAKTYNALQAKGFNGTDILDWMQVSDDRADTGASPTSAGYTLKAQLTSDHDAGTEAFLPGMQLLLPQATKVRSTTIGSGTVDINTDSSLATTNAATLSLDGAQQTLMTTAGLRGTTTAGWDSTKVKMDTPMGRKSLNKKYQATIKWSLQAVPGN